MGKDLRNLLKEAGRSLSIYRNPDIEEAHKHLSKLFEEIGAGNIGRYSHIESISEIYDKFYVEVSYENDCGNDAFTLPSCIVDADDPVAAARKYRLEQELMAVKSRIENLKQGLEKDQKLFNKLLARLEAEEKSENR